MNNWLMARTKNTSGRAGQYAVTNTFSNMYVHNTVTNDVFISNNKIHHHFVFVSHYSNSGRSQFHVTCLCKYH